MAHLAVQSWGDEVMFHNCPTRKENMYWQDDEVYWEIRGLTTCAQDYSIVLPKGTIKKLIGRDMTWKDEPVNLLTLTADVENNDEWKVGDVGYFFNDFIWKTIEVKRGFVDANKLTAYGVLDSPMVDDYIHRLKDNECHIALPEGYQFVDRQGNIIDTPLIMVKKKGVEYPKTFEECVHVLEGENRMSLEQMNTFRKLIDARNAYWKIAGEEMGLGKPWEPDWKNDEQFKYIIICRRGCIIKDTYTAKDVVLAFPTEELRDMFYERFKSEIELCKELI